MLYVTEEDEAAALYEEATMPLQEVLERYKGPLANLSKKGGKDCLSPAIHAKQDKPPLRDEGSGQAKGSSEGGSEDCQVKLSFGKLINGHSDNENNENIEREIRVRQRQQGASNENGTETQMDTSSAPEPASSSSSQGAENNGAGPGSSSSSGVG